MLQRPPANTVVVCCAFLKWSPPAPRTPASGASNMAPANQRLRHKRSSARWVRMPGLRTNNGADGKSFSTGDQVIGPTHPPNHPPPLPLLSGNRPTRVVSFKRYARRFTTQDMFKLPAMKCFKKQLMFHPIGETSAKA